MGRNATSLLCRGTTTEMNGCSACTTAAHLQTTGQAAPRSTLPSFYTIMKQSIVTHIPSDFAKKHAKELSSTVQLEGTSGQIWFAGIATANCGARRIRQGWSAFSRDHNLEKGDVLIFQLIGKAHFLVQIFDKRGCQKETAHQPQKSMPLFSNASKSFHSGYRSSSNNDHAFSALVDAVKLRSPSMKSTKEGDCFQVEKKAENLRVRQGVAKEGSSDVFEQRAKNVSVTVCESCAKKFSFDQRRCAIRCSSKELAQGELPSPRRSNRLMHFYRSAKADASKEIKVEIDLKPDVAFDGRSEQKLKSAGRLEQKECRNTKILETGKRKRCAYESELFSCQEFRHKRKFYGMERPPICESCEKNFQSFSRYMSEYNMMQPCFSDANVERKEALKAAVTYTSNSPTVTKIMQICEVSKSFWLGIPKDFALKWLPKMDAYGTLIDSFEKRWIIKWIAKRNGLSGGWKKFAVDHNLKVGDVCIFEVIKTDEFVLQVHILKYAIRDNCHMSSQT